MHTSLSRFLPKVERLWWNEELCTQGTYRLGKPHSFAQEVSVTDNVLVFTTDHVHLHTRDCTVQTEVSWNGLVGAHCIRSTRRTKAIIRDLKRIIQKQKMCKAGSIIFGICIAFRKRSLSAENASWQIAQA